MFKTVLSKKEWLDHIGSHERDNAIQHEYCREHGLSLSTFRYWKTYEAREVCSETNVFIEIPKTGKNPTSSVENNKTINLPNGCSLRVRVTGREARST